jgi:hypothetical protein
MRCDGLSTTSVIVIWDYDCGWRRHNYEAEDQRTKFFLRENRSASLGTDFSLLHGDFQPVLQPQVSTLLPWLYNANSRWRWLRSTIKEVETGNLGVGIDAPLDLMRAAELTNNASGLRLSTSSSSHINHFH